MKRITTWIAAALAVVAIAGSYQISRSGDDAQGGAQTAPSTSTSTKPDDGRAGGTPDEHAGKPGENK